MVKNLKSIDEVINKVRFLSNNLHSSKRQILHQYSGQIEEIESEQLDSEMEDLDEPEHYLPKMTVETKVLRELSEESSK